MSTQNDAERFDNPETVKKIEQAREQLDDTPGSALDASDDADELPDISEGQATEARRRVAREEHDDSFEDTRPDLQVTTTVEFRGHEFEFTELGARELEATKFHDIDEGDIERGSEAAEYVYKTLGDIGVGTDEAYWRRYSMQSVSGQDGLIDLFNRVITAFNEDIDIEDVEAAGNSRSASRE